VAAIMNEGGAEAYLGGLDIGGFYTGLTRDDVAGLRYLMRTNNINWETVGGGSLFQQTNMSTSFPLFTTDLGSLLMSARTNDPILLQALFPGLVVAGSSNYLTVVTNPIVVSYFTNYYGEPVGTAPHLVTKTNGYTYTPTLMYVTKFANVIITTNFYSNSYRSNTAARLQTVKVGPVIGAPVGTPFKTNVSYKDITLTNVPSGDYYLIPPGSCGYLIPQPQPSGFPIEVVTASTNLITAATNSQGYFYAQSIVTYATNHVFASYPCTLVPGDTAYYQGIQKVRFVRIPDAGVDPLTGNLLQPFWVTNTYSMVFFNPTNSQLYTRYFQRVVTSPDVLLTASDQALGPAAVVFNGTATRDIHFTVANILPNLAGPGTIDGPVDFDFNKVGTAWWNGPFADTNSFVAAQPVLGQAQGSEVNESTGEPILLWASFDGSTNDPVVYPNNLSIQQLEDQMVVTILPQNLPDGTDGEAYSVTFTVTGGQPPYTWSLAPDSNPLPGGLVLSADGLLSGTLTDNPAGTYDFTIQMNDSAARSVQRVCSINIQ